MIIGSPYTFPSFRLFELEPRTKSVFGFPTDADVSSCPRLQIGALIHSKRLIHMLDTAIDVVGPDPDLVSEVLSKLPREATYPIWCESSLSATHGDDDQPCAQRDTR